MDKGEDNDDIKDTLGDYHLSLVFIGKNTLDCGHCNNTISVHAP